ncbi:hypothetical protein AJ80_08911 [Polytolypa hystricis UAMH7299]|uniref:GATA-type domain-containing protein n=1 Tax=Polytolypa hystricis (strain UAMH7299) TaxID=1447883 RepID=A0A2B7WZU8_POLH7|nr:hypothetical protein AJ80_08911 [Polytolypa hystricis UAMH7299]
MGSVEAGSRHWPAYGVSGSVGVPYSTREAEGNGIKEAQSSVGRNNTSRDSLPSIGFLELDNASKDGPRHPPKFPTMSTGLSVSTAPMISPTTAAYPGPPPPYSYPSSGPSTTHPPPGSTYVSPTDPRRPGEDEKQQRQHNQTPQHMPQRQSLPSIHEALGNDNPLPYPPPPASAAVPSKPGHPVSASGPIPLARPTAEGPSGPPNPFMNGPSSTPFLRENPFAQRQPSQSGPSQPEGPRSSLASIHSQESRNPSIPSLSSGKSPTQSSKTGAPSISNSQGSTYEFSGPSSAGPMAVSPTGYGPYPPSATYPPQHQQPPPGPPQHVPYQAPPYDTRPGMGPVWSSNPAEAARIEEAQRGSRTNGVGPLHTESVKRHLEGYDVEASVNELADISVRTLEFTRHCATRVHQSNRSGPVMGTLPTLAEVDDMLQLQRRSADALARLRSAILSQERALAEQRAEQRAQRHSYKPENAYDEEHVPMYREEFKSGGGGSGSGGFAGGDAKKRRGKAAPPGRCHSCNRAETPEWRRGPDGARTLCNACGLHYAKLTRKMGASKASALGSNLRPKNGIDPRSPTHP